MLSGLPSGAAVQRAYLYWITYAATGDDSITLEGNDVAGTLIGTGYDTCWPDEDGGSTRRNFVYRADVTARVQGNGTFELKDFPSSEFNDTQGASLFVVHTDPNDALNGTVFLRDGALTINGPDYGPDTFPRVTIPPQLDSLALTFGAGDGQSALGDGPLFINRTTVAPPGGAIRGRRRGGRRDRQLPRPGEPGSSRQRR